MAMFEGGCNFQNVDLELERSLVKDLSNCESFEGLHRSMGKMNQNLFGNFQNKKPKWGVISFLIKSSGSSVRQDCLCPTYRLHFLRRYFTSLSLSCPIC